MGRLSSSGSAPVATTTQPGTAQIDVSPVSGNPIAVTQQGLSGLTTPIALTPPNWTSTTTDLITGTSNDTDISFNTTGAVDETLSTIYEAQQFTTGTGTPTLAAIGLQLKITGTGFVGTDTITCTLYSDSAGVPGASIQAALTSISPAQLTGSYATYYFNLNNVALSDSTSYWIVVQTSLSGGSLLWQSRTDIGTNVVATSSNGTTWTLSGTTKTLRYRVMSKSQVIVNVTSNFGVALNGTSLTASGVVGRSTAHVGGFFTSTNNTGMNSTSTYGAGAASSSTWGRGGDFSSTQQSGLRGQQNGTLTITNGNAAFNVTRSGTTASGINYTGDLILGNDNPAGIGTSSGKLLRLQTASVDKITVDRSGNLVLQGTAKILNATTISSGSGAPTTPGGSNPTAGDLYVRTDTPSTANQRIYVCTVGGASPTWVGIV